MLCLVLEKYQREKKNTKKNDFVIFGYFIKKYKKLNIIKTN